MAKKHKNWKPQKRFRQKATTGKAELVDIIYMDTELDADGERRIFAICTCGEWRTSDAAETFGQIGKEAKGHVEETGHQLRRHSGA